MDFFTSALTAPLGIVPTSTTLEQFGACVGVYFVVGLLVYGNVFSGVFRRALEFENKSSAKDEANFSMKTTVFALKSVIISAGVINALQMLHITTPGASVPVVLVLWGGLRATTLPHYTFPNRSLALFLLDAFADLLSMSAVAFMYAYMV